MSGAVFSAARAGALGRAAPGWLFAALLALPFLIGIVVLQGLTVEIDTFHGSDARVYQLPTILQLSERLDLSSYPSAQTPLFHLVMAGWGKLVGFELWKLRLLSVAISYGMALALLHLLRRATPLAAWPAFALTLLFVLSPYVLGASFTLLTDNLALLFALLALERIERFRTHGSLGAFALACLAIAGAVLTRQSFLWLALVAAWFLLRSREPLARRAAGAALLGLALVPLAALVVEWGGLVPPGSDPASCGLCTDRPGVGRDALTLRTVGFTLALLGAYAALIFGPSLLRRRRLWGTLPGRAVRQAAEMFSCAGDRRPGSRSGWPPRPGCSSSALAARLPGRSSPARRATPATCGSSPTGCRWCWTARCCSGCSCPWAAWRSICWCAVPAPGRCRRSTWRRSWWRRCRSASSTRSTSTPSCCWRSRCSPGPPTCGRAGITRESC